MKAIGCDVIKSNQKVMTLLNELTAGGEKTNGILVNLFKGYMAVTDKTFKDYISRKEETYMDGTNITYQHLMVLAANNYKTLKQQGR